MTRKIIFSFLFAFGIIVFVGCSSNVSLRGTVTYSDDDSPLTGGTVCLSSTSGTMSRGDVQSDGTYVMGTKNPGDGVPPGTYSVFLINTEVTEQVPVGTSGDFTDVSVQLVDSKYNSASSSEMTLTVDKSTKTFDFKVERYKGKQQGR